GLHRHPDRPRPELADDAGLPDAARGEAEALRDELPPALADDGAAPPARAGLARRRRARADGAPGLADRRLARARGVGHDGDPGRRAPEPAPHPARRRLGGAPAAQGLPDRRRAGALLRGGIMAAAPRRAGHYEGTRL